MRLKFTLVMLAFSLLLLGLTLAGCDDDKNSAANMAAAKQKCFNDCNQDAQKAQQNNETVPDCAKDCEDGMYRDGNQSAGNDVGAPAPSSAS